MSKESKEKEIKIEDGSEMEGLTEEAANASADDTANDAAADDTANDVAEEGTNEGESLEAEVNDEAAEGEESEEGDDPWQTKYMRLMADFQNYKKRTAKEVSDIRSSASEKVMTGILDVLDNFERAFEQGCTDEKFAEGMDNIFKQLVSVLSQSGLEEMEVIGQDFDPNFHNAAVMEETDEHESGKISGVVQKGYTLNGKVIRPPMVKVAK